MHYNSCLHVVTDRQTDRQTDNLSTAPLVLPCKTVLPQQQKHAGHHPRSVLNLYHSLTHDMMTLAVLQSTLIFNQSIT